MLTCGLQSIARPYKCEKKVHIDQNVERFFSSRQKWTFIGKFCFINLERLQVVRTRMEIEGTTRVSDGSVCTQPLSF